MRHFGLIGYPLSHSFSKGYFADKFLREGIADCSYENFPISSISELSHLIAGDTCLAGLNVTIPYKEQVLSYLDEIDGEAQKVGAVNTLRIQRNGKIRIKGYNTDVHGFRQSIGPMMKDHCRKALILGTGGASKAVAFVLAEMGLEVLWVSRNPVGSNHIPYSAVDENLISESHVIVNASPIGMYPNIQACPDIPYTAITPHHLLYDLIYNPEETQFLTLGKAQGAEIKNGLQMLYLQAERSWEIWNSL
jgi:shikimate dehydrogenase